MIKLMKLLLEGDAKTYQKPNEIHIAINESHWSWEYDAHYATAFLYMNKNTGVLRLVIENRKVKSGLGKGQWITTSEVFLGTVNKPKLGSVRSILKDKGFERTRSSMPFSPKWDDIINKTIEPLAQIIAKHKSEFSIPAKAKIGKKPGKTLTASRSISVIASEISRDWKNVNFAAKPYLEAMFSLNKITDKYMMDSGKSIVAYFLSNASGWKGENAKRIKNELKIMLKK